MNPNELCGFNLIRLHFFITIITVEHFQSVSLVSVNESVLHVNAVKRKEMEDEKKKIKINYSIKTC